MLWIHTLTHMQRLDSFLLAGVGVLIVHQVAYTVSALFGIETSIAHGHMAFAWFGGSLAMLGVLARSVTLSLKRRRYDALQSGSLALVISLGYTALEQIERLADGYGLVELFGEPVFWLGLALAPLVALVLHWSVRSAVELVATFLSSLTPQWSTRAPQPAFAVVAAVPVTVQLSSVMSRRGPPVR